MCKNEEGTFRYAPLCICSFRLYAPRMVLSDVMLVNQHQSHTELKTVQERIRWCRQKRGLMQKEVAELLGVSRAVYYNYESGTVDYYPKETMDKLAEIFEIDVFDLLDDYNRFLYTGQGRAIREYREGLGLKKKTFARMMGIEPNLLRAWEDDKKRMSINSWNKYFREVITV